MLTLESEIHIPTHVVFSIVGEDAFLLNMRNNKYYGLEKVGMRLWQLLKDGTSLTQTYQVLLKEYEVEPKQLEQDILELLADLKKNELLEIVES